jgi:hypothetical protein
VASRRTLSTSWSRFSQSRRSSVIIRDSILTESAISAPFVNEVHARTGKKIARIQSTSFIAQAKNIEKPAKIPKSCAGNGKNERTEKRGRGGTAPSSAASWEPRLHGGQRRRPMTP